MSTPTTIKTSSATGTTSVSTTTKSTATTAKTTAIASTSTPPKNTTIITTTTTKTTPSLVTTTKTTTNATTSKTSTSTPTKLTTNRANSTTATQYQTTAVSTDAYSSTYTSTRIKPSDTLANVTATQPGETTESLNPSLNSTAPSSAQRGLSSQDKLAIGIPVAFAIAIIIAVIIGVLIWRSRRKRQNSSGSVVKSSGSAPPSSVDNAKWPDDSYCDGEQGKYVNFKTRDTEMYTSIHLDSKVDQNDHSNYLNADSFMKTARQDNNRAELASLDYEEGDIAPQYANEHDNKPKNTHVYLVLEEEADKDEIASARNAQHLAKNRKRRHDEIYSLANDTIFVGNAIPSRAFINNETQDEVSGETAERNRYSQGGIGAASRGPKHNSSNQDSYDVLLGNGSSAHIYFELEKDSDDVVNGGSKDSMVKEYMNIDEDGKQ